MRQIKAKDTKPELVVRKYLHSRGLRYKLHDKTLPGKPDMVFPRFKTVLFIHGCFWHGHESCKLYVVPKTRTEWWVEKISRNKKNDKRNADELTKLGLKVLVVHECELKLDKREHTLKNLFAEIKQLIQ